MTTFKKEKTAPATTGKCECGCACDKSECTCSCCKKETIIKSAVMLASAIFVCAAILTAGYDGGCPSKGPRPMGGNFDAKIQEYIMKNPKVLIDSVDGYYRSMEAGKGAPVAPAVAPDAGGCGGDAAALTAPQKAPDMQVAPKELVDKILADKTNHVLGNPKGSYVIIEFFDYQCGWCKKTNQQIGEAVKSAKNIRWVLIDTPIFGPSSEIIAHYAMAAGMQGKFKEYHEAIVVAPGKLDEAALIKIGEGLKLDTKKLTADANGDKVKAKMAANQEYARKLNINGVPMVIVDGKINPGALINERLDAAVKASNEKK